MVTADPIRRKRRNVGRKARIALHHFAGVVDGQPLTFVFGQESEFADAGGFVVLAEDIRNELDEDGTVRTPDPDEDSLPTRAFIASSRHVPMLAGRSIWPPLKALPSVKRSVVVTAWSRSSVATGSHWSFWLASEPTTAVRGAGQGSSRP
jgi:hypothetical protein